jgi:hypothetical protein
MALRWRMERKASHYAIIGQLKVGPSGARGEKGRTRNKFGNQVWPLRTSMRRLTGRSMATSNLSKSQRGLLMKKLTIVVIGCIAAASLAGCVGKGKGKGKGKTPPPAAVVTKG